MAAWIFLRTSLLVTCSLYEMFNNLRLHLIAKVCVHFSNSAVKVHDSQAYRNMEMTRERINFTFDLGNMLLFLQMGFSFGRVAVACSILERISGLEPSSETSLNGTFCFLQYPTSAFLPLSLSVCHWRCLSSVWSSWH